MAFKLFSINTLLGCIALIASVLFFLGKDDYAMVALALVILGWYLNRLREKKR